jgi:hypothetical protein
MNKGQYVFSQLISLLPRYEFDKCVARYNGNYKVKDFTCWMHFLCMSFGQLTNRESLRDIVTCLQAHEKKLYHLGISHRVVRTTLAYANENRDWHIYADFAQVLIAKARKLYLKDSEFGLEIQNTVYALDSTTIDLCLSVFWWAPFRKKKAAIKLHTLMDLRGAIPSFIHISDGKTHDVNILDLLDFEAQAFYVMDKAYVDYKRFYHIHLCQAYFVIRAKENMVWKRIYSHPLDKQTGLRCDQTIKLTGIKSAKEYPQQLRRVKYYDKEQDKTFIFLTNNFDISALEVALIYKNRWKIELFFKWIKQHLKIKAFWGESENAVKVQVWIAICSYLTVAIAKKELKIDRSLYEILQILSVSAFDKTPVNQLLMNVDLQNNDNNIHNQLIFKFL